MQWMIAHCQTDPIATGNAGVIQERGDAFYVSPQIGVDNGLIVKPDCRLVGKRTRVGANNGSEIPTCA